MRLYEFQAKEIFSKYGIRIPRGYVSNSPLEIEEITSNLNFPVVIKAQILMGGRGLAGGIKFAYNPREARELSAQLLGATLKGEKVNSVLIEEKIPAEVEYFAGVTIDYNVKRPVVIASSKGGVDIESIALRYPEEIIKEYIDLKLGLTDYRARFIAKRMGLRGRNMLSFSAILQALYKILLDYDANLVEANPLALTADGSFIALDAKIILDDNASFRHQELYSKLKLRQEPEDEKGYRRLLADKVGIPTYIELGGNIGIIADGAGTGMLTLDLTRESGGDVGTYCELGGRATSELIEKAMEIVFLNKNVKVLLINLIGGLNRMDEMAKGIISFTKKKGNERYNIVVRMSGTLEDEGRKMLREFGINAFDNIYDAIDEAIKIVGKC
ncbi:MAG: ATP-grasp domain-containing protein [Candidatus Bathyarchaeia archaeon]